MENNLFSQVFLGDLWKRPCIIMLCLVIICIYVKNLKGQKIIFQTENNSKGPKKGSWVSEIWLAKWFLIYVYILLVELPLKQK